MPPDPELSGQLLSLGARALAGAGITPDGPLKVLVRCRRGAVLVGPDEPPPGAGAGLPCIPSQWQRILDCLAGADGEPLSALEVHRRLNQSSEAGKAPPELYARLQDLDELGLVEQTRSGYRLPSGKRP